MPKKSKTDDTAKAKKASPGLSLHVEPADDRRRNVNAEYFFELAERWLKSLKVFASDTGQHVEWEIVELRKSSAFVQVRPVEPRTRKPVPLLVRRWDAGVRELQRTGRPPQGFTLASLEALEEFVKAVPMDSAVTLGNGARRKQPLSVTAETQRRIEQAVAVASSSAPAEYAVRGTLRGRLAVLDSWNPAERFFRLQLALDPGKRVLCTYRDGQLVSELGSGFEGTVEVGGVLHYRRDEVWPHRAEVETIHQLSKEDSVSLNELVGLVRLPDGVDSVSYVRSIRDAD